jgi:SagB-type dehydrogenase family enzyme
MDKDLRQFLYALHFDTDKVKPSAWQPDWKDAPLSFKLYRENLAVFPLPLDVPVKLPALAAANANQADEAASSNLPDLRTFGHFLWYTYGITQVSRSVALKEGEWSEDWGPAEWYHRAVPSGGGLYPNEIYVYLKLPGMPAGIYHYDAAHHRLILLREGRFDEYVDRALGGRCRTADAFAVLFISVYFWKNFFKYYLFSYRLQGLDTGVLLGQLREAAARFGFTPHVFGQFLDRALNHLLGLAEEVESVYAVVPLAAGRCRSVLVWRTEESCTAQQLIRELPSLTLPHYIRSRNISPYPLLLRMHQASLQEETAAFHADRGEERDQERGERDEPEPFPVIPLPSVPETEMDLADLTRKRYSPETDFVFRSISLADLSSLLRSASAPAGFCDLDAGSDLVRFCRGQLICGTFSGVEGLESGAYRYDAQTHSLKLLRSGDHREWLQYGMLMPNVNMMLVPTCFHIAGDRGHCLDIWGARGYRLQQMEAGMRTQRLLLAAAAHGWGGRPLLSFDAEAMDDLYRLPRRGQTALIQVPAGPYRFRARWANRMHG